MAHDGGEAPAIPAGLGHRWQWTPDDPLGGSFAWSRQVGWFWRLPEARARRTLRWVLPPVDGWEPRLQRATRKACRAARRALRRSGGVAAHGEAHRHPDGRILLVLHLDIHEVGDAVADADAVAAAFRGALSSRLARAGVPATLESGPAES